MSIRFSRGAVAVETDDYYQLLGISRFASQETIKHAFRTRIRGLHPDHNVMDPQASDRTRAIIEAYKVLNDPPSRRQYDLARLFTTPTPVPATTNIQQQTLPYYFLTLFSIARVVAAILLLVIGVAIVSGAISINRTPVYRAVLIDQPDSAPLRSMPVIVEPSLTQSVEWYQAREYQLSLANRWAEWKMTDTYRQSARAASKRGDKVLARFYNTAIQHALHPTLIGLM
ncbi:MAG: J domain-containing protein [Armatimonadota bacterium]|nr:J domain-containing protein [bacterium]